MLGFVDIGFLPITIWDALDVFIVGYLIYRVYILLRGSIAFNIFIGVIALYAVWWLVRILDMELLSSILDQLVNVGVILLIIIFQPEVRRFLLLVGNSTLKGQSDFFNRLFNQQDKDQTRVYKMIDEVKRAASNLSRTKTGALIIFSDHANVEDFANSGVKLNADLSAPMIESVFFKDSPLHDGAMIVSESRIKAAGCVLPVTGNVKLPQGAGLRHRAGVGATIGSDVITLMVSEETGGISIAQNGILSPMKDANELKTKLQQIFLQEEDKK